MKIVITGALGHIGSKLLRDLPKIFPGCRIVMIDNLMTQRYCSLFNLPKYGKYKFIEGDITKINLYPYLKNSTHVIHLAAITDAASSFGKEKEIMKNNYCGTKKVASICKKTKSRFLLISSTSVYGTQKSLVAEDCGEDELKPQSPYAFCKLKEEKLIRKLCREGLQASIFRFGTIFGISPGIRFHTAVNKFCWQAAHQQPITVWRTALHQKRPYLSITDAVRAIVFFINNRIPNGNTYNVVTTNYSVFEILREIKKHLKKIQISFVSNKIMNQLSYEVSNQKIQNSGFRFKGKIGREIKKTLALFKPYK